MPNEPKSNHTKRYRLGTSVFAFNFNEYVLFIILTISFQLDMFLSRLTGPIGLTALNLFVIDKPAILTIRFNGILLDMKKCIGVSVCSPIVKRFVTIEPHTVLCSGILLKQNSCRV